MTLTLTLETNVILYHLEGKLKETFKGTRLCVSIISQIELLSYRKLDSETESRNKQFLLLANVVPVDEAIAEEAIRLRQGFSLKTPDAIIAATSVSLNSELVSNDLALLKSHSVRVRAPEFK